MFLRNDSTIAPTPQFLDLDALLSASFFFANFFCQLFYILFLDSFRYECKEVECFYQSDAENICQWFSVSTCDLFRTLSGKYRKLWLPPFLPWCELTCLPQPNRFFLMLLSISDSYSPCHPFCSHHLVFLAFLSPLKSTLMKCHLPPVHLLL